MSYKFKGPKWQPEIGTVVMVLAEFLGTGLLLFVGCMAAVGSLGVGPLPSHQIGINFGLVVNGIIVMLGHISGAYINPAVTLSAMICGYRTVATGLVMMVAQVLGAILGYGLLKAITPASLMNNGYEGSTVGVCMTLIHSELSELQGLVVEIVVTLVLMMVNCAIWDKRNATNSDAASLKIGLVVAGLSVSAGPYTGCSMNPARSLGPSVWNNDWTSHWVYWVGPFVGSIIGTVFYQFIFTDRKSRMTTSSI